LPGLPKLILLTATFINPRISLDGFCTVALLLLGTIRLVKGTKVVRAKFAGISVPFVNRWLLSIWKKTVKTRQDGIAV
jgi:hypothetical protein